MLAQLLALTTKEQGLLNDVMNEKVAKAMYNLFEELTYAVDEYSDWTEEYELLTQTALDSMKAIKEQYPEVE